MSRTTFFTRISLGSPPRLLGAVVVLLLLMPAAPSAEDPGGGCGDSSTPNLVITAANAGQDGPRLTFTLQTDKDGIPHWNLIYRDGDNVLDSLEIHRVFLKGHEGEEPMVTSQEDGCGGGDEGNCGGGIEGDCGGDDDDGCSGDDEGGMTGAAIRGIGYVNGAKMRFQMDLKDFGHNRDHPDRIRVRWRPFVEGESGHGEAGGCQGQSWTNNFWVPVQQINIVQR